MARRFNPFLHDYDIYEETLPEKGTRLAKEAMEEFNKQVMKNLKSKKE